MVRGRFAPSPSGRMHLGNLFCALLSYLSVKSRGGEWILRIEDLDTARCRPDYARQVEEDLQWLGLAWDEGGSAGGPDAPYFQSQRTALYEAALERLRGMGSVYPGTCRGLTPEEIARREAAGRKGALRLRVPKETVTFTDGHLGELTEYLPTDCGDFLLRRSDGLFAYQLAVVVDDAAMGITEVVRGADLLSSTPRQLLLYELLGWEAPEFFHFPLLLSPDGRRLSKRDGDLGLASLRERYTPEEIVGKLAYLAGLNPGGGPRTPEELAQGFHWDAVPRQDIRLPEGLS